MFVEDAIYIIMELMSGGTVLDRCAFDRTKRMSALTELNVVLRRPNGL